jgi:UDP-glucose 4-epimerase
MFGFGKPTRDYVHVADVTDATLRATGVRGTFNIATGVETPVSELFSILSRVADSSVDPEMLPLREGELERSCMDPSRARAGLGWRAQIELDAGLEQTYRQLVTSFEAEAHEAAQ